MNILTRKISIHAPPRGATCKMSENLKRKLFQFTPLREGRRMQTISAPAMKKFQFTPLREGRRQGRAVPSPKNRISIHAPPRGATSTTRQIFSMHEFQFTPLREGRQITWQDWQNEPEFQFTPLREGRPPAPLESHRLRLFQFTPLREGRQVQGKNRDAEDISIHAPPRGATRI